jgi:hypothetical protein
MLITRPNDLASGVQHFQRRVGSFRETCGRFLAVALAGFAISALGQDLTAPDYFATTREQSETSTDNQSNQGQAVTEDEAEKLIAKADEALQKLAAGDVSGARAFASIFAANVDYYDEGRKTPDQIAAEKLAIFRNYRSYSTQRVRNLVLTSGDSPTVALASFGYRYEIVKKSGEVLRGTADANWAIEKVGERISVIGARETTHRH